jgi:hypothetical protein
VNDAASACRLPENGAFIDAFRSLHDVVQLQLQHAGPRAEGDQELLLRLSHLSGIATIDLARFDTDPGIFQARSSLIAISRLYRSHYLATDGVSGRQGM